MSKIFFFTPAVPNYRVPFFSRLSQKHKIQIETSKVDFLGVKSVDNLDNTSYADGFINILGLAYWYKGMVFSLNYNKGDIVIINGNPRIINYMLLFLYLKITGIKTVWWGHGWSAGSHGFLSKLRINIMRALTSYYLFYTDSEVKAMGLKNSYALNNGLDSESLVSSFDTVINSRKKKPNDFKLVFIGRITEKSKLDLIIKSLQFVDDTISLNVIGGGDIKKYKKIIDELSIKNEVIFHGELFDNYQIEKILLESSAFIYGGAVGLSLIHAFNFGLPAIVNSDKNYHMPEFSAFSNGVNGVSFEPNNIIDMANAINKIYFLKEFEYIKICNNALQTVRSSYNVENMVSRFENMLKDICV